jgi:hypothetical protein
MGCASQEARLFLSDFCQIVLPRNSTASLTTSTNFATSLLRQTAAVFVDRAARALGLLSQAPALSKESPISARLKFFP